MIPYSTPQSSYFPRKRRRLRVEELEARLVPALAGVDLFLPVSLPLVNVNVAVSTTGSSSSSNQTVPAPPASSGAVQPQAPVAGQQLSATTPVVATGTSQEPTTQPQSTPTGAATGLPASQTTAPPAVVDSAANVNIVSPGERSFSQTIPTVPTSLPPSVATDLALSLSRVAAGSAPEKNTLGYGAADVQPREKSPTTTPGERAVLESETATASLQVATSNVSYLDLLKGSGVAEPLSQGDKAERGDDGAGDDASSTSPGGSLLQRLDSDTTDNPAPTHRQTSKQPAAPGALAVFVPDLSGRTAAENRGVQARQTPAEDQRQPPSLAARIGVAVTALCMALGAYWAARRPTQELLP